MANYKLSQNAKDDLERIWLYGLDHWGIEAADNYYASFFKHFTQLSEQPLLYPVTDIRNNYRRSVCGSESVYYRIEDKKTIEIMAVIGQQDITQWL